jgi:hypothetical protein
MMNITICTEVAAAAALLVDVVTLAAARDRPSAA